MKVKGLICAILPRLSWALQINNRHLLEQQLKVFHAIETCDVSNCTVECFHCNNGRVRCEFCKGTGFFTIGEDLIGTNNVCPACNGCGERFCKECAGTGKIAKWYIN